MKERFLQIKSVVRHANKVGVFTKLFFCVMRKSNKNLSLEELFPEKLFEEMLSSTEELMVIRGGRDDANLSGVGCGNNCGSGCGILCGNNCE